MEKTNQKPTCNNIINLPKQLIDLKFQVGELKKELSQTLLYLLIDAGLNASLAKVIQSVSIKKKWTFTLKYAYKSEELQSRGVIKSTEVLAGLTIAEILQLLTLKEQQEFLESLIVELSDNYKYTQAKLHQSLKYRQEELKMGEDD